MSMILESLYKYAVSRDLFDPGFQDRSGSHCAVIDPRGRFVHGYPLKGSGGSGPVILHAPMAASRSGNILSSACIETPSYFFGANVGRNGADKKKWDERAACCGEYFRLRMQQMAKETKDPYAKAFARFLDDLKKGVYGTPTEAAAKCLGLQSGDKPLTGSEWCVVAVTEHGRLTYIHDRPAVRRWVVANRPNKSGDERPDAAGAPSSCEG